MSLKWARERSRNTSFIILKTNSIHYAYGLGDSVSIGLDERDVGENQNILTQCWVPEVGHSVSLVHLRTINVSILWACQHDNTCCIGWKQSFTIIPKVMLKLRTRLNIPALHDLPCKSVKCLGTFGASKGQNRCPSVTKWATGRQLGSQIMKAGTNVLAVLFVCLYVCLFISPCGFLKCGLLKQFSAWSDLMCSSVYPLSGKCWFIYIWFANVTHYVRWLNGLSFMSPRGCLATF